MGKSDSRPVAIVTGSASGIGRATAVRLARSGFDVVVNYATNASGADETIDACREEGADAVAVQGDVSSEADCRLVVEAAVERWGRLDVLVNNAGTTKFASPKKLDALSAEDFSRINAVNVAGTYLMIAAAHPRLDASPIASIVNVSSQSGLNGVGSSLAYAASKGALNTLTLGLARSLAPKVRVNAVCPGFVDTEWHAKSGRFDAERMAAMRQRITDGAPLKRLTTAEDVAEAIVWLALGARAVTGVLLSVDGGMHLTLGSPP